MRSSSPNSNRRFPASTYIHSYPSWTFKFGSPFGEWGGMICLKH
ncbi:Uncharacterised protein [Mycobacteroides abscessus subsp. abscessus]|nr:Uncharacterised protein [Mycobacteroides abscessus subsp. abscessus]